MAGLALVLAAVTFAAPTISSGGTPGLAVTGYQEGSSPSLSIDASAAALTTVGVDGVNLLRSGQSVQVPDAGVRQQLSAARRDHLRAVLLFGNFDGALGDFSEPTAHRLLSSSAAIAAVSRRLASVVRTEGWDGISVDLESLQMRDEPGLTKFVRALRNALPRVKTISVDITNYTRASDFVAGGYDLRMLGRIVDELVLMAYDQHGPWENTPGPVGALPWQRAGLAIVLRAVPRAKVTLGVAGYGYAWRPHSNYQVSDAQARALVSAAHATARFDARVGEWSAALRDGSSLWWSDARAYRLRIALARGLHLRGLAVWSLGLSDPLTAGAR